MRRDASGNALLLVRIENRVVLVAFVQGIVGPFHENFGPFDQRRGEKTGEGADQDFLKKRGVHTLLIAASVP